MSKWFIGALAALGALPAAFAQCSDGSDGPFAPGGKITLNLPPDGVFNFTTINIASGVTVRFNENAANTPALLFATGDVTIDGVIQISAVGRDGGVGGGDGGVHGHGAQDGTDGSGPAFGHGGPAFSAAGGGGMATEGLMAIRHTGGAPAPGGPAIPFPLPVAAGSGGGGGGVWVLFGVDLDGGDGGGAGGGVVICSATSITINGQILANGVNGGTAFANAFGHGGPGGGGSGGAVDLQAPVVHVGLGALLRALGGAGGGISTMSINDPNFSSGANGAIGYVRVLSAAATIEGTVEAELIVADPCPADLDEDDVIGLSDLSVLLSNFGATGGVSRTDGDLDGDDDVDLTDLALMLAAFGTSC